MPPIMFQPVRPARGSFRSLRRTALEELKSGLICSFRDELMAFLDVADDLDDPSVCFYTNEQKVQRIQKKF